MATATFERLLAVGLLLHESVYLADWGSQYYRRCFAPALGVRVAGWRRVALHCVYSASAVSVVLQPRSLTLGFLTASLALVIAAYPVRLSNHLVLGWFLAAGSLFVRGAPRELSNYVVLCLSLMFGAAGFAKLNVSSFRSSTSCGHHFARALVSLWGFPRLRDSRLVTWLGGGGIVVAELATSLLLLDRHTRAIGIVTAFALMILFGLLCHVHFATIVCAGLLLLAHPRPIEFRLWWLAAGAVGASVTFSFGNWRLYRSPRWACANQLVFGLLAGVSGVAMIPAAFSRPPSALAAVHLPHGVGAVLIGLFALNGAAPYLGLKTAYSFAMFSNLRPDAWDHLVVRRPARAFATTYVHVAGIDGLPPLAAFEDDPQLRRIVSELHLWRHRRYTPHFLAEARRVLAAEGLADVSFRRVRPKLA